MTKNLTWLSKIFLPHKIYIVGGYNRNTLLGLPSKDIDLSGALTPDQMLRYKSAELNIVPVNPAIGTLLLIYNQTKYEYTCFRKDNYPLGGHHRPTSSVFVTDIYTDASRRDFTLNAIYYDIVSGEYVDPLDGITDLKNRILKACSTPKKTLSEDGLRLMRLARFAAQYDLRVEDNTLAAAKKYCNLIKDISGERIKDELVKILTSQNPMHGIKLLIEIGVSDYILPELGHINLDELATCFKNIPAHLRPAAIFAQLLKENANIDIEKLQKTTRARLRYFPKTVTARVCRLLKAISELQNLGYQDELPGNQQFVASLVKSNISLYPFVQDFHDIVEDISALTSSPAIMVAYHDMVAKGIPMTLKDLKIKGTDLKDNGIPANQIGKRLNSLLKACATNYKKLKTKPAQLDFVLSSQR